jgi:hypothetical protein
MVREDASDSRDVRWQQWQGDRHIVMAVAEGGGGDADSTTIASTRQGQGDNGAGQEQVRQGQCNDGTTTEVRREKENG